MKTIRVLIADDSDTMRRTLVALVERDPNIEVVGCAQDGEQAVAMAARLLPDVITMDLQMPKLGGIEAIDRIMAKAPSRILVVCSVDDAEIDLSFRAIAAGALEVITKPNAGPEYDLANWGRKLVESIRLMAEVPVIRRRRKLAAGQLPIVRTRLVQIIGIVSSTGGPQALASILAELPAALPVPVLVAQHMTPGFVPGFVRWLEAVTVLKIVMSRSGEECKAGHVYLPPDSHDQTVDAAGILKVTRNFELPCPSGDRLLTSVAAAYGGHAVGVVLTGMGDDGARGLLAVRKASGITIAQDEESCVVYGMPRAAFEMGAASTQLPLSVIARELLQLTATSSSEGGRPAELLPTSSSGSRS